MGVPKLKLKSAKQVKQKLRCSFIKNGMCVGGEVVTLITDIDTENDHNFQNSYAQLLGAKVKLALSQFDEHLETLAEISPVFCSLYEIVSLELKKHDLPLFIRV